MYIISYKMSLTYCQIEPPVYTVRVAYYEQMLIMN